MIDPPHDMDQGPALLTIQGVDPIEGSPGQFRFSLPDSAANEFMVFVECTAKSFPFEEYCRFVRHPGGDVRYVFTTMEFHEGPPGMRLGPWPGWRGIPELPVLSASSGSVDIVLRPAFWGDEITCGILRLYGRLACRGGVNVTISSSDSLIIPHRVSIYRTHVLKARRHTTGLAPELAAVHPRLLITPKLLPALRTRATGSHRELWAKLISVWNNRLLPFQKTAESKCVSGPERLSGEDRVLVSAFIAQITERRMDIQEALAAFRAYVEETTRPDFEPLGIDTQAGEVLFIMSVGYDWLHSWIPEIERKRAWKQIEHVAGKCAAFLSPDRSDYGQAHYLGCGLGLLAYSMLAGEEDSRSSTRTAELRGALDCALQLLPDDGSYPHGINLWIYEFGFLLRWIELFRGCGGDDPWVSAGPALERASEFRASTVSSDARHGITFGDPQYLVGGDSWCHFLVASRTGSSIAQWLGERLEDLPHEGVDFRHVPARRRVYEFLFFDPGVAPAAPLAGARMFADIGQVTVRSARTLFTMRSGPPLGRKRYVAGEYGAYGHSDPANGSFLMEHDGRFVACGPGPVYRRDTALHNVVTIDGQGQVGDSCVWLPDFFPPELLAFIPVMHSDDDRVSLSVDLMKTYLPHLGLERYVRGIFVDPERFVLGVDDVACRSIRSIEWNVHSRFAFVHVPDESPLTFDLGGGVRLAVLAPMNAVWETGLTEFVPAYPNDGTRDYRCAVRVQSRETQFVWCYLLTPQPLPKLRTEKKGKFTVEFAGGARLSFDGRLISTLKAT